MSKISRDLVEYSGVSSHRYSTDNFRQFNIDYMFNIPIEKPDINQIIKVCADPSIISKQLVKTPKGTSLEGETMTGYKLLVSGDLSIKIEYVSCDSNQSVHSASSNFPFSGYVVLPEYFNVDSFCAASVLIEDIFSEKMDLRCIYNNITIILIADLY